MSEPAKKTGLRFPFPPLTSYWSFYFFFYLGPSDGHRYMRMSVVCQPPGVTPSSRD